MDKHKENTKLLLVGKTEINTGLNPDKEKYPKAVFFIIGNEFCERFSYYGMKAILTLFLVNIIRYDDDTATTIYHTFSMGCYFTPIFGAMLADSFLGKYKTIFYISIIYALGNIVLASAAIPNGIPMIPFTMIGLTLIAVGTGGIKPCVAAFGGDQFSPNQEKELQKFFSFFYLSINCGSMISTILTPYLREDVKCFGDNSCFALAFGVPAILMIVSLIIFVLGRPLYKIIAPTGNIVVQVVSAICHALGRKIKSKAVRKEDHWLNYAEDKYDKSFLSDIKDVLHVLFLYLPLPVFWALFDQQGSRWTLQANAMDGHITGKFRIKPDQMQMINPFLILFFIPLFEYCIYPLLEKCHLLVRPLQRITTGGILASAAFIVAAFVQIALEKSLPVLPSEGLSQVSVINTLPCNISLSSSLSNVSFVEMIDLKDIKTNHSHEMEFFATNCSYLKTNSLSYNLFTSDAEPVRVMMITDINNHLSVYEVPDKFEKPDKGESKIRILFASSLIPPINSTITFYLSLNDKTTELKSNFSVNEQNGIFGFTDYVQVDPGIFKLAINNYNDTIPLDNVELNTGGSYIVTVVSDSNNKYFLKNNVIVQPNSISMLYQIPQYVIMTAGEIMFSITGLEFSYSQAPTSMKSVLQAAWLLTVAFGNIIVVIVSVGRFFSKQSYEFFMFAGLMVADMMLFSLIAYFYKYVEAKEDQLTKHNANENNHSKGIQNAAYLEDSTSL
ncbi:solute carrier family 15 member 1-like isoform X1 [Centruroides sculpturatus]|uniref:solute carrier family 15 member 1-like isoform X1 n=2 Tax=Centruroides sculpturatus TaxID=218467 RepID=UPI000C6D90BF|nr:solute carrier family 15 member 1-like isoform X1 [Centruroides sculpturatus]